MCCHLSERRNQFGEKPEMVRELKDLLEKYRRNGRSTPGPAQHNDVPVGGGKPRNPSPRNRIEKPFRRGREHWEIACFWRCSFRLPFWQRARSPRAAEPESSPPSKPSDGHAHHPELLARKPRIPPAEIGFRQGLNEGRNVGRAGFDGHFCDHDAFRPVYRSGRAVRVPAYSLTRIVWR